MKNQNDTIENKSEPEPDQFANTKKWNEDVNRAMWEFTGMAVKNRQAHIELRDKTVNDLNLKLNQIENTNAKIDFLFNEEKKYLDLITSARIKKEALTAESYEVVMNEFIIKQKNFYSKRLEHEINFNRTSTKIDKAKSAPTPEIDPKPKILISDEILIQKIATVIIRNKWIDEFFKEYLLAFLRTGKVKTKLTWKGNKNVLTTLFYLLHYHHKTNCTKKYLAEAILSSFDFKKDNDNQDTSLDSILQDFQDNKHLRRIKADSKYYKEFLALLQ